jgi:phosphate transport system permease protein
LSSLTEHLSPRTNQWRRIKDRIATVSVTAGGAGVLFAILLIFFYLLYEVVPLFSGASVEAREPVATSLRSAPMYLAVEEQGELALAVSGQGVAHFLRLSDGSTVLREALDPALGSPDLVVAESAESRLFAAAWRNGEIALFQHQYRLTYPGGEQVVTPRLESVERLQLAEEPLVSLTFANTEDALVLVGGTRSGAWVGARLVREENFLSGEVTTRVESLPLPAMPVQGATIHLSGDQRWLYHVDATGAFTVLDLQARDASGLAAVVSRGRLFQEPGRLQTSTMLLGGISLLASSDRGELVQAFMVRDPGEGHRLQRIRSFDTDGVPAQQLVPEHRRKGFLSLGSDDTLQIFHTTAHRRVLNETIATGAAPAAIAPRGDLLVQLQADGQLHSWELHNKHPDISWTALWDEVWYESYDEPAHIWQSSASDNDFEPKLSFAPLAFGTLKAAFYTMLIAAPLAICGAIYTAYFMAPALRRKIKPLVELMEALPTVILGFLAGLWLAPLVEDKLTAVVTLLLAMPVGVLLFAFLWSRLPLSVRARVPEGWHAAVLVPVVIFIGYVSFAGNDALELWLFGGDMRRWVTNELGIPFDQRNSLVVGIAMGMAVIPTIFSIAEDAIFSVPRHLSYGSLALGATPWQTLVGVVLPTASPGIFSGLMIGLGRAVGETMIVLMATGNTPIMDANIFEGMRTLSANIAVEIPEAEVDSTHYRVLFLAAFVLFLFTFVVNTAAEIVRQRLRIKYGSL